MTPPVQNSPMSPVAAVDPKESDNLSVPSTSSPCEASTISHRKVSPASSESVSGPALVAEPAAGLTYLRQYPDIQLPRLLVDGVLLCREKGLKKYAEREKDCLHTQIDGWSFILEQLSALSPGSVPEVNLTFVKALHRRVAGHYPNCQPGEFMAETHSGYYQVGLHHKLFSDVVYFDEAGLVEAENIHSRHLSYWPPQEVCASATAFALLATHSNIFLLPLPSGMALQLYQCHNNPEKAEGILLKQLHDKDNPGYEKVICFYKRAVIHFERSGKREIIDASSQDEKMDIAASCLAKKVAKRFAHYVKRRTPPVKYMPLLVENVLSHLHQQLLTCRDRDQLLSVICSHISQLEQIHPFKSVNGRTFTLLMQYLLMAYGQPPGTFNCPERFLYCSHETQVAELKSALEATESVLAHGQSPNFELHGYRVQTDDPLYNEICTEMAGMLTRVTPKAPAQLELHSVPV